MACSRANSAATRSESSIAVLSMISNVSVEGAIPLSRRASTTSSYSQPDSTWCTDTFTATPSWP